MAGVDWPSGDDGAQWASVGVSSNGRLCTLRLATMSKHLPTPPESVSDEETDDDAASRLPHVSSPSRALRAASKASRPPRPPNIRLSVPPSPLPPSPLTPARPALAYSPPQATVLDSEAMWLLLYFSFNLALTLYNKLVLVRFPFPYTLTALHAFCGTLGSYLAMELGYFTPTRLAPRETLLLSAFSVLYTVNIAVSNISLQLVTVPFHQVVRAATPLFVIALSFVLRPRPVTPAKLLSLVPVVLGVGFATYGDYYYSLPGLLLTLLGTLLAALKTIATHALQTGPTLKPASRRCLPPLPRPLKLHPLDLLLRMSPLAFIQCVLYAHLSGELSRVRVFGAREMVPRSAAALVVNGAMAFGLNVVSFTANSKVGPLSITVAGKHTLSPLNVTSWPSILVTLRVP